MKQTLSYSLLYRKTNRKSSKLSPFEKKGNKSNKHIHSPYYVFWAYHLKSKEYLSWSNIMKIHLNIYVLLFTFISFTLSCFAVNKAKKIFFYFIPSGSHDIQKSSIISDEIHFLNKLYTSLFVCVCVFFLFV